MKLMVISSPVAITGEATITNSLFAAGLELLHLRKPSYSKKELIDLALQIDPPFRDRLVLHSHHMIASNLGIRRLHFPEAIRLYTPENELKKLRARRIVLSTSIHAIADYAQLPGEFSYTFFGPVFESISKEGYGPPTDYHEITRPATRPIELIAIGGITPDNLKALRTNSFDGAAILGAIWSAPEKAIETFKLCQHNANS